MVKTETVPRLEVLTAKEAGPYIIVPMTQLDDLRRVLDAHQIRYEVDDTAYQIEDEPEVTFVSFLRGTQAEVIQALLDQEL